MASRKISFDGWVLDRDSGDLSRGGSRQRLQELPLKVLDLLLATPGTLVTREQLIAHLWPKGVVDFDTGLNTAVRKLRVALGDIADAPRYIETIPRRGYRFLGTVDPDPPAGWGVVPQQISASTAPLMSAPAGELPVPKVESKHFEAEAAPAPGRSADLAIPLGPNSATPFRHRLIYSLMALALCLGGAYWLAHRPLALHAPTSSAPAPLPQDQSIAVLPFENLSAEPNNEFLAMGIAEAVLHRLASLHGVTVIARTSSFVFKDRRSDAREIGRALNARYLVEGSVQRAGESLRVQAEFIEAATGKQLWSLTFDRPLADIFAMQDEISSKVAEQLSVSLAPLRRPSTEGDTSHIDAYLAYLQGRAQISTGKISEVEQAVQSFARAAQIDPQFAAAYAQESRAITRLNGLRERDDPEQIKLATSLNDRALALDPRLGEAWVQRANLLWIAGGEKNAAEADKAYKKGLELEPNYGQGFEEYADFLWDQKRLDEALNMAERARQVDPLTPRHHYLKALMLRTMGKDSAEVESLLLQALKLDPTYPPALARLGQRYGRRGEFAGAAMLQERALSVEPNAAWIRGVTAAPYLSIGDFAAAEEVLNAERTPRTGMTVCVQIQKGDHVAALRQAYDIFGSGPVDTLTMAQLCAASEILSDALASRHFDRALRIMESQYSIHTDTLEDAAQSAFIWGVPFAHLLRLKGDTERGNRVAKSILASADRDPEDPSLLLAKAGALVVLGDHERAVDALVNSVQKGARPIWWIMDKDPIFEPLKHDPRYKALASTMTDAIRAQAALVAKMRASHELPQRPANAAAAK